MSVPLTSSKETTATEIQRLFDLQLKNQYKVANETASQRKAKLKKLHKAVLAYRPQIKEALYKLSLIHI